MPRRRGIKILLAGLGVAGTLSLSPPSVRAVAATVGTTVTVTATVPCACLISATNLAFGTYSGTQTDATSTLTVTCPSGTHYNVGLDAGTASGATVTTRKMTGPAGALLGYALYRNSARTRNWGDTVGTDTEAGNGNGRAQTLTVYGRVTASQYVAPGVYVDTITATVTY